VKETFLTNSFSTFKVSIFVAVQNFKTLLRNPYFTKPVSKSRV